MTPVSAITEVSVQHKQYTYIQCCTLYFYICLSTASTREGYDTDKNPTRKIMGPWTWGFYLKLFGCSYFHLRLTLSWSYSFYVPMLPCQRHGSRRRQTETPFDSAKARSAAHHRKYFCYTTIKDHPVALSLYIIYLLTRLWLFSSACVLSKVWEIVFVFLCLLTSFHITIKATMSNLKLYFIKSVFFFIPLPH